MGTSPRQRADTRALAKLETGTLRRWFLLAFALLAVGLLIWVGQSLSFAQATDPLEHGGYQNQLTLPVEIKAAEAYGHLISVPRPLRTSNASDPREAIELEILVDLDGNVVSVNPIKGAAGFFPDAIREARAWKYRPFFKEGRPVPARFDGFIAVLPPELLPTDHVPFPPITDKSTVKIVFTRTECFGTCPVYEVQIEQDGTLVYNGRKHVVVKGQRLARISAEELSALLELFRNADFFSLDDKYALDVTDGPTYVTSITIDGRTKTVADYLGVSVGMPQSMTDLEQGIDRIAQTAKWVVGADADKTKTESFSPR
jgi:hypothetical protein